jgi:hypothetical protein
MGHYGEFGFALWATAADLDIRYGPLWHGFDYPLWATVQNEALQDLVMRVPHRHGGGWSKKINAWYLNTLMVYL